MRGARGESEREIKSKTGIFAAWFWKRSKTKKGKGCACCARGSFQKSNCTPTAHILFLFFQNQFLVSCFCVSCMCRPGNRESKQQYKRRFARILLANMARRSFPCRTVMPADDSPACLIVASHNAGTAFFTSCGGAGQGAALVFEDILGIFESKSRRKKYF